MIVPLHVRVPHIPIPLRTQSPTSSGPSLPPGRSVELPGRGTTFVRELPGPPGAPTVVLLHGLTASADLNWAQAYPELASSFHVLALDHRGHGRGIRSGNPFTLQDCADDVAALADVLGVERLVAVGYSMGGPVAQLLARSRPDLVAGLVLCCTSGVFNDHARERLLYATLPAASLAARWVPTPPARMLLQLGSGLRHSARWEEWMLDEVRMADPLAVLQAAEELGRFDSRPWVGDIPAPSAVVGTTRDQLVPFERQLALALALGSAPVHLVDGDHFAASTAVEPFNRALLAACQDVARRSR